MVVAVGCLGMNTVGLKKFTAIKSFLTLNFLEFSIAASVKVREKQVEPLDSPDQMLQWSSLVMVWCCVLLGERVYSQLHLKQCCGQADRHADL